ncbi:MAG TPA: DUF6364 family protein [Puia sp.]|uniref:DUF6364 family protein n=1 Tax=Puia sp. TaxID=2045100 RepID=UPI002C84B9D9|nr:DUF6364 family protein [Puia sp.]HVU98539.1 DUF6364 family protein [Puia sp.]
MKERLNLTIDGDLLNSMKTYASKKQMSVSELVEGYFRTVTKPVKKKNILELMRELPKPVNNYEGDITEMYYKERASKYGF